MSNRVFRNEVPVGPVTSMFLPHKAPTQKGDERSGVFDVGGQHRLAEHNRLELG